MKLQNKKTGEIKDTKELIVPEFFKKDWKYLHKKLNCIIKEWEIYEEPKEFYYITTIGDIEASSCFDVQDVIYKKEIGNYFETREEAEKAVEKLKARQRLKDKGLKFMYNKTLGEYGNTTYRLNYPITNVEEKDLNLLFGGENE